MYTEGPAINLRTSCWLLPQKVQQSSFSVLEGMSGMVLKKSRGKYGMKKIAAEKSP